MDYTLQLISNKPHKFLEIYEGLTPERLNYFDGARYPSFSKLVNSAITSSITETVILLSDKVKPTSEHVKKLVTLLDQGYALVGLWNFAFFGFKKELMRQIGMFDERYVGGGFEDYDFLVRIAEKNLAIHMSHEIPFFQTPSSWGDYSQGYNFWCQKWRHYWVQGNPVPVKLERTMSEEIYNYNLGPSIPTKFLPKHMSNTEPHDSHVTPFLSMEIV